MDQEILKEIGRELREHRTASGLTILELSKALRIRKQYLEGIELGNKNKLPPDVYIIGYIKHYAKFFNLDTEELIARLKFSYSGKVSNIGNVDVITDKELLPDKYTLIISLSLFILLYIIVCFLL